MKKKPEVNLGGRPKLAAARNCVASTRFTTTEKRVIELAASLEGCRSWLEYMHLKTLEAATGAVSKFKATPR